MDTHKQFRDRIKSTLIKSHVDLPFEPTLSACQEWADSLPILNTALTADLMSVASQALLSIDINPLDKFKISEAIKPYSIKLLSTCSEELERKSLPLSKKTSNTAKQTLNVLTSFHLIYIDIACSKGFMGTSSGNKRSSIVPQQQRELILHRAMELLGITQLFQSLIYMQPDHIFWSRANALFEFAESLSIQKHSYLTIDESKSTTIENIFKEIHYFHLAATNRFRQNDIKTIHQILALQSDNILMTSTHDDASTFCVDLASSSPATPVPDLPADDKQYRFLNNEHLIQFMQSSEVIAPERQGVISLASKNPILSKGTIHQLLPSWRGILSRKETRHEQTEEVTVYPGFDSIIRALLIKQNPHYFKQKGNLPGRNLESLHLVPIDEPQRSKYLLSDIDTNRALKASVKKPLSSNSIWTKKSAIKPGEKGESLDAETNDASLQGLMFTVSADNQPLLKANDLIGIQTKNESIQLAIIRRINTLPEKDISVGAEMMSPSIKIANIKFHDKETPPKPVLFLQGIPAVNQPDAIISPFLIDNTQADIIFKKTGATSTYLIDKTLETNQVFTHYTVLKEANVD